LADLSQINTQAWKSYFYQEFESWALKILKKYKHVLAIPVEK